MEEMAGQPAVATMSKARKLEPPILVHTNVHKHGSARMPMSRKKRVSTKFNACKCCPMDPIKEEENEENEEMIGRVMEERSPNEEDEAEMVGEVKEGERGIFGVTNPEKVEVTVDSGASQSVWPRRMKGVKRFYEKPPKLIAANGAAIPAYGRAVLGFQRGGVKGEMKFWDADVKEPFGAVSAMIDEGNTVVLRSKKS